MPPSRGERRRTTDPPQRMPSPGRAQQMSGIAVGDAGRGRRIVAVFPQTVRRVPVHHQLATGTDKKVGEPPHEDTDHGDTPQGGATFRWGAAGSEGGVWKSKNTRDVRAIIQAVQARLSESIAYLTLHPREYEWG